MRRAGTARAMGGALLASVVLSACGGGKHERSAAADAPPPASARVVTLVRVAETRAGTVEVPGVVQARQRAVLVARLPGAVLELPFREGDRVAAGAVVARLDDGAARAGLGAAEAALWAAEAERRRLERLREREAATPREVEDVRARAAAAEAVLSAARENLAYAVLRAPFAGVVGARPANVGDVVLPGAPLVQIEGDGGLEVKATVEAGLVGGLRAGQPLSARVDGQAEPLAAVVRAVSPAGDPSTHRFEVRADLPATAGLRSGLFARLSLPAPEGAARLVVPETAVVRRGGLTGLFVVREGRARLRWVALGAPVAGAVEVRAGLEPGEEIAVEADGLADGTPVSGTR